MIGKENNYNFMKILCSKLSRNQIIEDLAIKCEELYLAREGILKKDSKIEQLQSNWNKLREHIGKEWYCFDNESVEFEVAKNILDKMNELEGKDKQ